MGAACDAVVLCLSPHQPAKGGGVRFACTGVPVIISAARKENSPAGAGEGVPGYILAGSPQVKPLAVTPSMTSARMSALVLLTACSR